MKQFRLSMIALFILASLFVGSISYGQTLTGINTLIKGGDTANLDFGTLHRAVPGYKAQPKFDTVHIRILYDLGGDVPACKNGWIVRQWNIYYDPWAGDCSGCPPSLSNTWIDTDTILSENKKGKIDKAIIWQYKPIKP